MSDEPSFLNDLKQGVIDYLEAKAQLVRITAYEKIAKVTAILFSSIVVVLTAFFLLFFLSISGGFFFGNLFHSNSLGFLTIVGIYLILLVLIIVFKKNILEKYIIDTVIKQLFEKEDNE
jgi:hypothetical protein